MEVNRKQKSFKNFLYLLVNLLVNLVLQFVNRTVFINSLGLSYLGINGLFSNVISLLNMADLGIGTAMIYSFYRPLAERNYEKLNVLLSFYKKIYYIISFSVFLIGMLLIPWLKYIINLNDNIEHIYFYYILLVINTAVSYVFVYKTCILIADQKQYIMTRYQIIFNVIRSVLQIIALLVYSSYILYLVIMIIFTILQNVISAVKVDKLYPIKKVNRRLATEDKKELKNNIFSMFTYKIASQIFAGTDNIILSALFGTICVGIYSNYLLIIQFISNIVGSVFSASTASIGNSIVVDNSRKRLEIFETMQTISSIIGIFFSCELLLLIDDFINLWLGKKFQFDFIIVIAIVINFVMDCGFQPIWCFRNAAGIFVKLKYIMIVAAGLNVALSLILGKYLGVAGVFFATSLSRLCSYFWYEPRILFKDFFEEKEKKYYYAWIKYIVNLILIMMIEQLIFSDFVASNWLWWGAKACVSSVITIFFILILYSKSKLIKDCFIKIKNMLKKYKRGKSDFGGIIK